MTQIDTNLERRTFTVHPFYILHPNVNHDDVNLTSRYLKKLCAHTLAFRNYLGSRKEAAVLRLSTAASLGSRQTFSLMNY